MGAEISLSILVIAGAVWAFIAFCAASLIAVFDGNFYKWAVWVFFLPVMVAVAWPMQKIFPNGLPLWFMCVIFVLLVSAVPLYLIWS